MSRQWTSSQDKADKFINLQVDGLSNSNNNNTKSQGIQEGKQPQGGTYDVGVGGRYIPLRNYLPR